MKNIFILAAAAAFVLGSCSNEEIVKAPEAQEDGAVVFSAYAGRNTRAAITNVDQLAAAGGFGVYAYEQGLAAWNTYSASNSVPNFMYNQQIKRGELDHYTMPATITKTEFDGINDSEKDTYYAVSTSDVNEYNRQAAGENVSPADYASLSDELKALCTPVYTTGTTQDWTYSPVKYYSNNPGAMHSFFAYAPYSKEVKTVFALGKAPAIRFSAGESTDLMFANAVIDKTKSTVNGKIVFNFQHGLSQVAFDVAPFADKVHQAGGANNHPVENQLADNTTITLRSIKFIGRVPSQGLMSLKDGSWTVESMEEGAYQIIPSQVISLDNTTTTYVPVANGLMVIPTQSTDMVKIQVIYDVVTVDPNDARNNSTVTNIITSETEYALVAGTSYKFHLDLGLTSVKFDATVTDWTDPSLHEHWVDLPNNKN